MIKRGTLLVGPPFERRHVEDLTREELIELAYEGYEQQEKYLKMLRQRCESMQEMMAAVAGVGR